jgi:hypothetical protein
MILVTCTSGVSLRRPPARLIPRPCWRRCSRGSTSARERPLRGAAREPRSPALPAGVGADARRPALVQARILGGASIHLERCETGDRAFRRKRRALGYDPSSLSGLRRVGGPLGQAPGTDAVAHSRLTRSNLVGIEAVLVAPGLAEDLDAVRVPGEAIDHGNDAGGAGEYGAPLLEDEVQCGGGLDAELDAIGPRESSPFRAWSSALRGGRGGRSERRSTCPLP